MSKSLTGTLPADGLLSWNLGYTDGVSWTQATGGDVYAASTVTSAIPAVSPRVFVIDGSGGAPGLVTYGSSYDFDSSLASKGEAYVSSTGWLAHESYDETDYYTTMFRRYDSPTATTTGDQTLTSRLALSDTPYYYDGSVTIDTADWGIPSGGNLIVFVSGNLTINRKIRINPGGFAAFIVKGDIIVSPDVGRVYTSAVPSLEGVYITLHDKEG